MTVDRAECSRLGAHLATLGSDLERYLRFEHPDAMHDPARWRQALDRPLPGAGVGIAATFVRERICRHNAMARRVAERAATHPRLQVVRPPTLPICCFRYVDARGGDLNELNGRIHRALVHRGRNIPSTAVIDGTVAIRPCFVGARTTQEHADALVDEVIETGDRILAGHDVPQAGEPLAAG